LSSPGKGILAADEAYKVAVRRRKLVLAFGLAAAIPFAATGVVLAMGASTLVLAAALATLYLSLFPIVAAASITLTGRPPRANDWRATTRSPSFPTGRSSTSG
jgi:hypothetical protein